MINQRLCFFIENQYLKKYFTLGIHHYNKLEIILMIRSLSLITITLIIWDDNKYQMIMYRAFHLLGIYRWIYIFCKSAKYDTLRITILDFNNSFRKAIDIRLKG